MRIIRGKGKRPAVSVTPAHILETPVGGVVFIAVRVCAHFSGPGQGPYTDVLCRPFDWESQTELHSVRDIYLPRAHLVGAYKPEPK